MRSILRYRTERFPFSSTSRTGRPLDAFPTGPSHDQKGAVAPASAQRMPERSATTPDSLEHDAPHIIVIASSLGGVRALSRLLGALPPDLPVPIAVVQHQSPRASAGLLTGVLSTNTALRVRLAVHGAALQPGTVLIAPPNRHFTLTAERTVAIVDGPVSRGLHSAADPLFCSAANVYGAALLAVILTGTDGDGADGARVVRQHGGRVIVQDPSEAEAAGMPEAALATAGADWVLPLDDIAPMLRRLLAIPRS